MIPTCGKLSFRPPSFPYVIPTFPLTVAVNFLYTLSGFTVFHFVWPASVVRSCSPCITSVLSGWQSIQIVQIVITRGRKKSIYDQLSCRCKNILALVLQMTSLHILGSEYALNIMKSSNLTLFGVNLLTLRNFARPIFRYTNII